MTKESTQIQDIELPYPETGEYDTQRMQQLFTAIQKTTHGRLAAYGGINHDILGPRIQSLAQEMNIPFGQSEICPEEDEALGLHMPKACFFSQMPGSVSMAMWYASLQAAQYRADPANMAVRDRFGTVSIVECYDIEGLKRFAEFNGYGAFSAPHDQVFTARLIAEHGLDMPMDVSGAHQQFAQEIVAYLATKTNKSSDKYIQELLKIPSESKERVLYLLRQMRSYWQEVLLPRGIIRIDEDIILIDQQDDRPSEDNLAHKRKPLVVCIGHDVESPEDDGRVMESLEFAREFYPKQTKILTPQFSTKDGLIRPGLAISTPDEMSIEALIIQLIMVKELGMDEKYRILKRCYMELVGI